MAAVRTLRVALVATMLAATAPAPVRAGPAAPSKADEDAYRQAFRDGRRLFDAGRWAQARARFERAYALRPGPLLLFNIASTYRREGNAAQAVVFYRRYLAEGGDDRDLLTLARRTIAELEAELEADADAKRPPTPPAPTPVPPATEDEPAPAARRHPRWATTAELALVVGAGATVLGVTDVRRAAALDDDAATTADPTLQASLTDDADRRRARGRVLLVSGGTFVLGAAVGLAWTRPWQRHDGPRSWIARPSPWLLGALGLSGGAAVMAVRAATAARDLDDVVASSAEHDYREARSLERQVLDRRRWATGLGVAAAAAGGVAALLYLGRPRATEAPPLALTVTGGGAMLTFGGRL